MSDDRTPQDHYYEATVFLATGLDDLAAASLEKAASQGHVNAMCGLGWLLETQGRTLEAREWYLRASRLGDSNSMCNLGNLALKEGDKQTARGWYRDASDLGYSDAMLALGVMAYHEGDRPQAQLWYSRAATQDNVAAMYNLGLMALDDGDTIVARRWFSKAATLGHESAAQQLAALELDQSRTTRQVNLTRAERLDQTGDKLISGGRTLFGLGCSLTLLFWVALPLLFLVVAVIISVLGGGDTTP